MIENGSVVLNNNFYFSKAKLQSKIFPPKNVKELPKIIIFFHPKSTLRIYWIQAYPDVSFFTVTLCYLKFWFSIIKAKSIIVDILNHWFLMVRLRLWERQYFLADFSVSRSAPLFLDDTTSAFCSTWHRTVILIILNLFIFIKTLVFFVFANPLVLLSIFD